MDRQLKKLILKNTSILENSKMDFEALYSITFGNEGIIAEDTDGFRINSYTYCEIRRRIEEASCALYNKIGATHSYVAIEMENSVHWIVAFWAILRSGNKPYLVNCRHPRSMVNSILKTLDIKYIIGNEKTELDGEFIDVSTLKTTDRFSGEFENEIALSTSATTLKETVCFYSGERLSSQILNVKYFMGKYPEIVTPYKDRIKNLAFLPFYHIFGLIAVYFWFTFFGQTIVFMKNYSPDTILKTCRKHEVTHIFAVPMLWHTIENSILKKVRSDGDKKLKKLQKGMKFCTFIQNLFPNAGMRLSQKIMSEVTDQLFGQSVRFCISGGSYIRKSALELINGIGYNLHNGYGMSEIGITSVELRTRPKHKNQNSIGAPFASVEYKIDKDGILNVKGSSICSKLLINGEVQPMDSWFNTGDIMEAVDGNYFIKGRIGDMIIGESGENINPDVIEQNFDMSDAENFCILGLESDGKKNVSMIVQLNKYMSSAKRNALYDKIISTNETLPITSRVQKIYSTTDNLCSATAVKVSRSYVARAIENGNIALSDFKNNTEPASFDVTYSEEMLVAVTKIVADTLNIPAETIDIHAHVMLDLDADSMQYFAILTALSEEFSVSAPEKGVLCYTIHEFCQYIERHI